MNKAILIGNVGNNPDVKYFDGGGCTAQLPLATTERGYTLPNGTKVPERTEWHNLVFRGKQAELVDKYVRKGDKLYVEGKILSRSYDDKNGYKRYVTEIYVDTMEFLTPRSQSQQPAAPQAQPQQPASGVQPDMPF